MQFISVTFLFLFLPAVLLVYYAVPGRKLKNVVLLLSSVLFCAWGSPLCALVLLVCSLFYYYCGRRIARMRNDRRGVRRTFFTGIVAGAAVLVGFRYFYPLPGAGMMLTMFMLQAYSYLCDVAHGTAAQNSVVSLGNYFLLFPRMTLGPTVSYRTFAGQLTVREESLSRFAGGIICFVTGIAKKIILGNALMELYRYTADLKNVQATVLTSWLGLIALVLGVYYDFSGYCDMAAGLGKMFGFELPVSFRYPFLGSSLREFWSRWNVSLGEWFREYVYQPVVEGNRKTFHPFALLLVWVLAGMWHGPGWNSFLWGLGGWVFLILEYGIAKLPVRFPSALGRIVSLAVVGMGFLLLFAPDLPTAAAALGRLAGVGTGGFADIRILYLLKTRGWLLLAAAVGTTPIPARLAAAFTKEGEKGTAIAAALALTLVFLLSVSGLLAGGNEAFLYTLW